MIATSLFDSFEQRLDGRDSRKVGNNTYLERNTFYDRAADRIASFIGVRLHGTYVVRAYEDGTVSLHTGGWHTVTTKDRINAWSPVRVFQHDYTWYVKFQGDGWDVPKSEWVQFEEGMVVTSDGRPAR